MQKKSLAHFSEILVEIRDGFNAFIEIFEVKFFIRAVQVIAIEPKAHEYDFDA